LKDEGVIDEATAHAQWVIENDRELEEEARAFLASLN